MDVRREGGAIPDCARLEPRIIVSCSPKKGLSLKIRRIAEAGSKWRVIHAMMWSSPCLASSITGCFALVPTEQIPARR